MDCEAASHLGRSGTTSRMTGEAGKHVLVPAGITASAASVPTIPLATRCTVPSPPITARSPRRFQRRPTADATSIFSVPFGQIGVTSERDRSVATTERCSIAVNPDGTGLATRRRRCTAGEGTDEESRYRR